MVADDDRGSGVEHLVSDVDVFGARGCGVLDAPVNGDDEKVALGAGGFDGGEDLGFVGSGRAADSPGYGKKFTCGWSCVIGIAIAVEPARHAQPADLDAVGLGDDGLPGLRGGVAGSRQRAGPLRADARGFR